MVVVEEEGWWLPWTEMLMIALPELVVSIRALVVRWLADDWRGVRLLGGLASSWEPSELRRDLDGLAATATADRAMAQKGKKKKRRKKERMNRVNTIQRA